MDKTITSKRYELKEIGVLIQGKDASERSEIKAKELAKVTLPTTLTHNGYDLEVLKQPHITIRKGHTLLEVCIKASKNGIPLNVGDGIFQYQNPPIMIPDGTFHKETKITPGGSTYEMDVPNFVEDPQGVLKEIIVETIKVLNKEKI